MLDKKFAPNALSLADAAESHKATIGASIDGTFHACGESGTTRCRRTEDKTHTIKGFSNNRVSRSD